jgi:hypothetical protein
MSWPGVSDLCVLTAALAPEMVMSSSLTDLVLVRSLVMHVLVSSLAVLAVCCLAPQVMATSEDAGKAAKGNKNLFLIYLDAVSLATSRKASKQAAQQGGSQEQQQLLPPNQESFTMRVRQAGLCPA